MKCFGAKGDGQSNDTRPIQDVIDTLDAQGGIVFFPPGLYRCQQTLRIGHNTQIVGTAPRIWGPRAYWGNVAFDIFIIQQSQKRL